MANYVLVHGSAHGAWCWERVVPLLEERGHKVVAVDLPGNGHDDTPLAEVTLETYAQHLCGVLDGLDGPAVLVGHSLGGISISRTAELRPDKVAVLVYLTAVLLQDGMTFMQAAWQAASGEPYDERRALEGRPSWQLAADRTYVAYKPELAQHRFYNDCSAEDVAWAKSMIVPQPVGPLVSPMRITGEHFGRVPRVFIECALDNAVSLEWAGEMYTAMSCAEVITMQTGHSPFLSAPPELADHLARLGRYAEAKRAL